MVGDMTTLGLRELTSAELFELGHRLLGTFDRWTVAFAS
jgi:hypothetical protein